MDRRTRATLACLLLAACQRAPFEGPISADESSGTGTSGDSNDVDGPPVTDDGDLLPEFACEPGDDGDCPSGEKCTAISKGGPQNHFECVPDDGVLIPGDECTPAEGTGQDGCTSGHVCLRTDPDAQLGRCLEACRNDADCGAGSCRESPYTLTTFCAAACDPIVPECEAGFGCRQSADRFVCDMLLTETDVGQAGASCSEVALRGCAASLACLNGALIPGCFGSACCADVCDLTVGDAGCPSGTLCRPLFTSPAPGFENVGACYVPA